MRSVVRRSSNNHMRTLVDTSRQFCSASPVKSIDIQLTLPWTLGGQQSLRLDHSQSLTSTLVNFKYTPMAKHGDGQKEMACPEFCEYSQWLLGSIANAPCLAEVLQHHTGVFQFVSSLLFLFVKLLQPLLKRGFFRALPISADPPGAPRLRRLARTGGFQGFSSFRLPVVGSTCPS